MIHNVFLQNLSLADIKDFCILKEQYWKYGIKKQIGWWFVISAPNDRIIYFDINGKKISFCRLKKRKIIVDNVLKDSYYLTELCVHNDFKNSGFASLIIKEVNNFIITERIYGHLLCPSELDKFYSNLEWKKSKKFFSRKKKEYKNQPILKNLCFTYNQSNFEEIILIGNII